MCGIVGYIGSQQAAPILLDGLSKLEYRGYDSAGVAVYYGNSIVTAKAKGRLQTLSDMIEGGKAISGTMGIGHTRWATHGVPSDVNSHPHVSNSGKFAVVHNGIIENYLSLKEKLMKKGFVFQSETDTEVIAHLIDYYDNGDLLDTVTQVLARVEGSYALGILSADSPDQFVAVRKASPLIVGLGKDGNFIASDIPAVINYTRDIYLLEDNEIVVLRKDNVTVYSTDKEIIKKEPFHVTWDISSVEKGGYEHFMFKEIMEQPQVIRDTIRPRIQNGKIMLDDIKLTAEDITSFSRIYIVACGSAYHVGVVGKYCIEGLTRIPVEVEIASEFRYRDPIINDRTLVIIISQSGETADTLAAMREAKKHGARTLGIVNVVGSSIAREADDVLYTWAGPEIAVATTKAYSTQLTAIYLLALYLAQETGKITDEKKAEIIEALDQISDQISSILERKDELQYLASKFFNRDSIFFIGRRLDYGMSLEGSLKLKEISYIHSEVYAAGELKHGTISLIEPGTLVVALATDNLLFDKMLSNIKEVKARGAVVFAVAQEGNTQIENEVDHVFYLPKSHPFTAPSLAIIPLQLFAYYVALQRGCDIDKPRNLAKSVTVE